MAVLLRLYSSLPLVSLMAVLRACGVTLLFAVWLLAALPARPLAHEELSRPRNAAWLSAVRRGALLLHLDEDAEAVDRRLLAASERAVGLRNRLFSPFESTFRTFEMGQRWGLFLQGQRDVFRMQVEGLGRDGSWRLLYRARKFDALGLEELLSYRRLRGIYNPHAKRGARADYEDFVTWLAGHLFDRYPRLESVRVSMQRYRLPRRDRPMRLLGTEHAITRERRGAT